MVGILDFPPNNLEASYTFKQFTIGQRLVVNLSWEPGASATGVHFSLESCTGGACAGFTEFTTDLVFSYVLTSTGLAYFLDGYDRVLTPSTIYRYRVRNQYAGGYSTYSNIAEITLPAFTPDPVPDPGTNTAPPLPPSNLEGGATTNTIDLLWRDNANNESGFILQRYSNIDTTWRTISSLAADTVGYSDTGLSYDTTYSYRIKAVNQYGESSYSNSISVTTESLVVAGLAAPTFSSAAVEFVGEVPQVKLIWVDNATTETAYIIERKVGTDGTFTTLFVASANVETFTDVNIISGGVYSYRIRAYRSSDTQYSPWSVERTVGVGTITDDGSHDGRARQFVATLATDRLDTGLNATKGSTDSTSIYAWVKNAVGLAGPSGTVLGGADGQIDAECRIQLRTFFTHIASTPRIQMDVLSKSAGFRRTAEVIIGPVGANLWQDTPVFIAFVNDVPNGRARFFWGFTPDSIVEFEVADFTTTSVNTAFKQHVNTTVKVNIGACGRETAFGPGAEDWFRGQIDAVGLEFDTVLTLNQLQERARCGAGARPYFWPITGEDPEEGIAVIHGTTVVDALCDPGEISETNPSGYGIVHDVTDPSTGGVIRDNQMSNNGISNISPNTYTMPLITIDNPGSEFLYIRRGQTIYTN